MARTIKLKFYDKTYTIEYANRSEVKEYFTELKKYLDSLKKIEKKEEVEQSEALETGMGTLRVLIKAGLVEHHKDEMPSDQDVDRWISSMPNTDKFFSTLMSMIQDVTNEMGEDRKNTSWEVEEN